MESRIAMLSIIVEDKESVEQLNAILHEYSDMILGRMGIPYRERNINLLSVAVDAPQDRISAMAGKIGNLNDVTVKIAYTKL